MNKTIAVRCKQVENVLGDGTLVTTRTEFFD